MRFLFLWGALLLFVLRALREHVLAGGPASQPQPPVERQHEGLVFRATCRLRRGRHEGLVSGLRAATE